MLHILQELFGPLSMRELENDQYVRQTRGYLPEASVAFIDEIFKANSAILNTLLTILNERLFDNGSDRHRVPLICMVSNSSLLSTRLFSLLTSLLTVASSSSMRDAVTLLCRSLSLYRTSFQLEHA